MHLTYSPQRRDVVLNLVKDGDALIVNGQTFDFSVVTEGATLPAEAIESDWFVGPVERVAGELRVTIALPHGPNPSHAVAYPLSRTVTTDGPIDVPFDALPTVPEPETPEVEQ